MQFLLQKPATENGALVKYDSSDGNLFTINERTSDKIFYQTFGDLVLNFDEATARLCYVDGRIVPESRPDKKTAMPKHSTDTAYLVTSVLDIDNIHDNPKYTFDTQSKVLCVSNPDTKKSKGLEYAKVLENVVVAVTAKGELAAVWISF